MRILLIAEESAGSRMLGQLVGMPHTIVAVMTSSEEGGPGSVAALARKHGLAIWPPEQVRDPALADRLRGEDVDLILNIHSLFLIDAAVVEAPTIGAFNLHPGPLPELAGLNAPSWALYTGASFHGVTVHRMVSKIDAGAIAYQRRWEIEERDTALTLSLRCVREGVPLLAELVTTAAGDPALVPEIAQNSALRRYFGREVPNDGWIHWDQPSRQILNFVRACDYHPFPSPWGRPRAAIDGLEIAVTRVEGTGARCPAEPGVVGAADGDGVLVASGDEWLRVRRIVVDDKPCRPLTKLLPRSKFEVRVG